MISLSKIKITDKVFEIIAYLTFFKTIRIYVCSCRRCFEGIRLDSTNLRSAQDSHFSRRPLNNATAITSFTHGIMRPGNYWTKAGFPEENRSPGNNPVAKPFLTHACINRGVLRCSRLDVFHNNAAINFIGSYATQDESRQLP